METWKHGNMETWNNGMVEWWNDGSSQHSIAYVF